MKQAIAKLTPDYNTARMVREYAERFYVPSIELSRRMRADDLQGAKALVAWKERVRAAWSSVTITDVSLVSPAKLAVGEEVAVTTKVHLGDLTPNDVAVEIYHGPTAGGHELTKGTIVRMQLSATASDGVCTFTGRIPTIESGSYALAARVMPYNPEMSHPYETSLVRWA
jgi:glycogen phosphorylase